MKDKIEQFRSYIDDEMGAEREKFELSLSPSDREDLKTALLIRQILSESVEELPENYMETLHSKLVSTHQESFGTNAKAIDGNVAVNESESLVNIDSKCDRNLESKPSLKKFGSKFVEFIIEFISLFKVPKYAMAMFSMVIIIAILPGILQNKDMNYTNPSSSNNHTDEIPKGDIKSQSNNMLYESSDKNRTMKDETQDVEYSEQEANSEGALNGTAHAAPMAAIYDAKLDGEDKIGKKLVYTANINIDTEDYDTFEVELNNFIKKYKGFVEEKNIHSQVREYQGIYKKYRAGNIIIRISSDQFMNAMAEIRNFEDVVNEETSSKDITLKYADVYQKKKSLEAREAALLKLMEKAQSLEDIVIIERELSEVRYMIDQYGSDLLIWDDMVNYSTFNIFINEVNPKEVKIKPTPKTLGDKINETFVMAINNLNYSIEYFILWVVYNVFFIVILVVVIIVLLFVIKKVKKNGKLKTEDTSKPKDSITKS